MIVVADTSAISNLLTIGRAELLGELFGVVVIPTAVRFEFLRLAEESADSVVVSGFDPRAPIA